MILICIVFFLIKGNEESTDVSNNPEPMNSSEETDKNNDDINTVSTDDIFYWGAEEYFYLLEGEWVVTEYAGSIRDSHFDEAGGEEYQEEVQDHTNEVIETYLGSEYYIEISNLEYFGPYVDLTLVMEDDQELFHITRFISGEFVTLTSPYVGVSVQLADKPERYQFIIDADGIVLIEIEHRFFRLEKKGNY